MTEPAPNPYAAPQSDVVDAASVAAVPARLPVLLLRIRVMIWTWQHQMQLLLVN